MGKESCSFIKDLRLKKQSYHISNNNLLIIQEVFSSSKLCVLKRQFEFWFLKDQEQNYLKVGDHDWIHCMNFKDLIRFMEHMIAYKRITV